MSALETSLRELAESWCILANDARCDSANNDAVACTLESCALQLAELANKQKG